jgi:DNA-binding transcriptional LysR family regulator
MHASIRPDGGAPLDAGLERRVTIHQLRLLVAVAEHGGVSRAADALGLSQPAVSHQLKTLSVAAAAPVIEVIGRRVHLTAAGEVLHAHARRILAEIDAADMALDELRGLRRGILRVVGDTTVGIYVLPEVLGAFRKEHPGIEVRLDIGNRQHVLDRLVANDVDFGVGGHPWDDPPIGLESRPFLANELIAIASPRHPLATATKVSLARLAMEPFIAREPGSGTRETTEEVLSQAHLAVRPIMVLASNGAIKRAVAQDLGVAVLSRYAAALEIQLGLLVELSVVGFPLRRQWHLFRARTKHLAPPAEAFLRFLDEGRWRAGVGSRLGAE